MFTHMTVGANDIEASRKFYDAALGALGVAAASGPDEKGRFWWRTPRGAFARPARAKARSAPCTWPICVIRPATRSAPCIASGEGGPAALSGNR